MPSGSHDPGERPHDVGQRIETFLGEFRIMVPALAVLLGFELQVAFQPAYQRLEPLDRFVSFAAVVSTVLALIFLLIPTAYHRLAKRLEESEDLLEFARRSFGIAFLFFGIGLALSLYLQAGQAFGVRAAGIATAGFLALFMVVAWWIVPRLRARRRGISIGDETSRR